MIIEIQTLSASLHLHPQTMRSLFETHLLPGRRVRGKDAWDISEDAIATLIAASNASEEGNWQLTAQVLTSLASTLDILYDLNRSIMERAQAAHYAETIILPVQSSVITMIDDLLALQCRWEAFMRGLQDLQHTYALLPPESGNRSP